MKKDNDSSVVEMGVYFSRQTIGGLVPTNILNNVVRNFSRYEVIHSDDGYVTIKVPLEEIELNKDFTADLRALVEGVAIKNAALGNKLVQRYGITIPR